MSEYLPPREVVMSFARLVEERWRRMEERPDHIKQTRESLTDAVTLGIDLVTTECKDVVDGPDVDCLQLLVGDAGVRLVQLARMLGVLTPEPLDEHGRQYPVGTEIHPQPSSKDQTV